MELREPFYVGIGVCSHEKDVAETAIFTNVELRTTPMPQTKPTLRSTLETVAVASTDRRVVHTAAQHFEAPNWTPDGKTLIFNGGGRLYRIPADRRHARADRHRLRDEVQQRPRRLARRQDARHQRPVAAAGPVDHLHAPDHRRHARRITERFPSYWHGWSPDGKTLAYCAQRDGTYGIFTIPAAGGEETRLTTAVKTPPGTGLDDGPDYSPDGKYIYFNSDRTGLMQIWRMRPTARTSNSSRATPTRNNWFPHPSPDGKRLVMLTYAKDVEGHPANKDVTLRLLNLEDGKVTVLAKLLGGQGTINVPSWSPDGTAARVRQLPARAVARGVSCSRDACDASRGWWGSP